ncbi:MAG: hypothetical protein CUN55_16520, partial [Phototrophicales bacterium]
PHLLEWEQASQTDLFKAIARALRDCANWYKKLTFEEKLLAMICRGLIFTADHAASAGDDEFPPMPTLNAKIPLQKYTQWRDHQTVAAKSPLGSSLLVAPTGSGKTEAAILWAERQLQLRPAARLFYVLPYQASMNAMAQRLLWAYFANDKNPSLADWNSNKVITIQHSRARLRFYQEMMEADETARSATQNAERLQNLVRLNYYPIQVCSPYQMLKAAYSLKGYEALLTDYANALFIFDEIHAYEPKRLALIITFMRWLAQNYG